MKGDEVSFEVTEQDLLQEVGKFVRGMTKEEMQRYDSIYKKW